MPTYQYRCKSCRDVQIVTHSMQSFLCPPCGVCGGLTEKIITQAPTVVSRTPETPAPELETHQCSSGCVLHRQSQPKPSSPAVEK